MTAYLSFAPSPPSPRSGRSWWCLPLLADSPTIPSVVALEGWAGPAGLHPGVGAGSVLGPTRQEAAISLFLSPSVTFSRLSSLSFSLDHTDYVLSPSPVFPRLPLSRLFTAVPSTSPSSLFSRQSTWKKAEAQRREVRHTHTHTHGSNMHLLFRAALHFLPPHLPLSTGRPPCSFSFTPLLQTPTCLPEESSI